MCSSLTNENGHMGFVGTVEELVELKSLGETSYTVDRSKRQDVIMTDHINLGVSRKLS